MSYFDDASLVMIPSGYKTSKVYSVKPTDGSGDLTFSRSNDTATRVNSAGLIEKVRTNLALYSEQFDNAYWVKYSSTITANTSETTDPLGGNAADILVSANATTGTGIEGNVTYTSGVEYTVSVYCKYKNTSFFQLLGPSFVTADYVNFNIQTGAIVGGSYSRTPTITSIGNGWYRCSFTFVSGYTGTTAIGVAQLVNSASSTRGQAFTGDGVKAVYIFGAQFETGVMTDYIATTSAAVSVGPVANVPRLDYLGSSCPRLLLEGQRVNLFQFSEQIDNAYWTKTNSTITANSVTSPDGYTNADTLTASGSGSVTHVITRAITTTSGSVYAFSVFAKKGNTDFIALRHDSGGTFNYFNINTGTKGATCDASATIENYGNGWYRCTVFHTATGSNGGEIYLATANGVVSFAAAGQFAYIYGAQYELGAYATSYIPTLGAAVTRGADAASKTGISSLIGQTEGTFFVEVTDWQFALDTVLFSVSDGTLNNYLQISTNSVSGDLQSVIFTAGTGGSMLGILTPTAGQTYKIAVAYKVNDFALYVNGVEIGTLTSKPAPSSLTRVDIGSLAWLSSGLQPRPKFAQAILFPTRLSNADLAALTA